MSHGENKPVTVEEIWREFLTVGAVDRERTQRRLLSALPGEPRCRLCNAPFKGIGAPLAKLFFSRRPSSMHPHLCDVCENFATTNMGGAEIDVAVLFADIRGSTGLAEKQQPTAFADHLNRFYRAAADVIVKSNGFVDKLVGDEVVALYVPGFAGPGYAREAVGAARKILKATGHGGANGPWIPVGVGVHVGRAYVGAVGDEETKVEITALGDAVNVGARLCSAAGPGEAVISEAALKAAEVDTSGLERRSLQLDGRVEPVPVGILQL